MGLANFNKVKNTIGETGSTNDLRIQNYITMADNFIIGDTIVVRNMPNPPAVFLDVLSATELKQIESFATDLAIAYFHKFESGDIDTAEAAEKNWTKWFIKKYRMPRFTARGGETTN